MATRVCWMSRNQTDRPHDMTAPSIVGVFFNHLIRNVIFLSLWEPATMQPFWKTVLGVGGGRKRGWKTQGQVWASQMSCWSSCAPKETLLPLRQLFFHIFVNRWRNSSVLWRKKAHGFAVSSKLLKPLKTIYNGWTEILRKSKHGCKTTSCKLRHLAYICQSCENSGLEGQLNCIVSLEGAVRQSNAAAQYFSLSCLWFAGSRTIPFIVLFHQVTLLREKERCTVK